MDAVFHKDWSFTRTEITKLDIEQTFLQPRDDSGRVDAWFNYSIPLKYYEELNTQIAKKQFRIIPPCPSCEDPEKLH
jgi:hypothetical protein